MRLNLPAFLALLLAPSVCLGASATPAPAAAPQQPEFTTLATPPNTATTGTAQGTTATKPHALIERAPVGTQTIAQLRPDGRVEISCHTRPLLQRPLGSERTP